MVHFFTSDGNQLQFFFSYSSNSKISFDINKIDRNIRNIEVKFCMNK